MNLCGAFCFHLELPASPQQNPVCLFWRRKWGVCSQSGRDHCEVLQNSLKSGVEDV